MAINTDLIDAQTQYYVTLNAPIVIDAANTLYPGQDIEMRGDLVITHAEALDSAQAV